MFTKKVNEKELTDIDIDSVKLPPAPTSSTPLLHSYSNQSNSAQPKRQSETPETPKKRSRCCGLF